MTLTWSWRDLRARWIQVVVIALVVAVGTGMYAGLMSNSRWAEMSYDASFDSLAMYDVHVSLAPGSLTPRGTLIGLIESGFDGDIDAIEERLLVPTQIDASHGGETVMVRGIMVGVDVNEDGPHVNGLAVMAGRPLDARDAGTDRVLIERNFGLFYELPAQGELRLAGGRAVSYVGHAVSPEYFIVLPPEGGFFAQAEYGVVFASLASVQRLSGLDGMVNDLVMRLRAGSDATGASQAVAALLDARLPQLGATVNDRWTDPTYRLLYDDLEGDQQFYRAFAVLIFAGAVAAAFNLTSRMVEANRREIGISMALGVPRRRIALRPLLVAAQIALLGVVLGVGVGLVVNLAMKGVLERFLPLPEWRTPFLISTFAGGAAIGFIAPFVAAALPVWNALRVTPIEAIRTGHLAARTGGLAPLLRRLPGDTFTKMPLRNLVRAPRRSALTMIGLAASVTVLAGMIVMIDSFLHTVDVGEAEVTGASPDRLLVGLDSFVPFGGPQVAEILDARTVSTGEPTISIPAQVTSAEGSLDLVVEVVDLDSDLWHPSLVDRVSERGGLMLAEKAARDLGVEVGDTVVLRHPRRQGVTSFALVDSQIVVSALHPHPFRFVAYVDIQDAAVFGLEGFANGLTLDPIDGATLGDVQNELFDNPTVISVQRAGGVADVIRDFLEQFLGILGVAEVAAVALMLLIAFNSASVAFDERARDHATMMAFGVRRGTIMRMTIAEGVAMGLLATVLGTLGSLGFVRWVVDENVAETMPDVAVSYVVTPSAVAAVVGLGVGAVALAPLLTWYRLRALDVPSTLRVME